ncbi:MAG: 30S ribosomal protein S2 [bacterium]|nr:30S ribosomal protein S2 [bacterium]
MPNVSIQQLLMAGTHFGHLTRRWNPKMKKYIFDAKHGIHIIDLKKTQICIDTACAAIQEIVKRGEKVLFVGTKKQAKDIIRSEASRINMPFVCERWLGGMLTNFTTIRKSLKNLQTLERLSTDGTYEKLHKKERLTIEKDKAKLDKALGGIRDMKKLPGVIFIVDTKKEHIAVAEARRLSIPIVALVDTNADPDVVNYPIPGNDDAFKSVGLITRALSDAIAEAAAVAAERRAAEVAVTTGVEESAAPRSAGRRRRPRNRFGDERSGQSSQAEGRHETLSTEGITANASSTGEPVRTHHDRRPRPNYRPDQQNAARPQTPTEPSGNPEPPAPVPPPET